MSVTDEVAASPRVIIIGAGPAGLSAASRLLEMGIVPLVVEAESQVGGISKTVVVNGNRIDIGGHRFFSKDKSVMDWWLSVLPLQGRPARDDLTLGRYVPLSDDPDAPDPADEDEVMLSRERLSRIYFLRRFFDYPVSLSGATFRDLGARRVARVGTGYLSARLWPRRPERSLEDFMINRFGRPLYELFFRDYTEKVWGVPCTDIAADWGSQRIKGISVGALIRHALARRPTSNDPIAQDRTQTSLIGRFLYPKLGPGQLWESIARNIEDAGGRVLLNTEVVALRLRDGRVAEVVVVDHRTGQREVLSCDSVLSSMPVGDLVARCEGAEIPGDVVRVAEGLPYRDFITCGLLVRRLSVSNPDGSNIRDNWIYVQEPEVRLGRLQVFNNWSPYLVARPDTIWLGLEYFCQEGDELWTLSDREFTSMAIAELESIGIIRAEDVCDSTVLRVRKAYPAYFGTYGEFSIVRDWMDAVPNLFVMGRNGMHRYNNMDHSMLSAWAAVDAMVGNGTRESVWRVNADEDYHEGGS